jgi:hypothetical protein
MCTSHKIKLNVIDNFEIILLIRKTYFDAVSSAHACNYFQTIT